jgi:PAS domain S-box-containing protein
LDATINAVLANVGRFMRADRCYLFEVTDDLTVADNTHEWCGRGIHAQIADLRHIPTASFPWLLERLRDGKPLCLPHVADIPPEAAAERQLMEQGQVKSVILVPIRHTGKLIGFVGCDAVRGERHWPDSDVRLLRIISETLADAQVRCRSEEALRSAAREWTATFDGVADAVWVLDDEQRVLRCNKASTALFGKSKQEMMGRLCWEIVHGTRTPITACPFTRMKRNRQRETMELALGERWYQVVVDPLMNPDGKLQGAVHIVRDITLRKQNEVALRNLASELERRVTERTAEVQRLAAIVQHSSELVSLTTPDLRCVFINDAGARLLGTPAAEIGQHSLLDFLPEAELQRFQQEILPAVKKGRVWQGEMQYRNGVTGDIAYVASAFFSIPDPATGRPLYLATTSIDITARKALEHQVLEISEREQRRIGHDLHDSLGQQLAAVKFMSGTLSKRLAKDKLAHSLAAAQIERELQHAMEEVRTISRGLHPIRPEGTSLQSALYEMAAGITRLFKRPCHFACPRRVVVPDVHAATHLFRIAQEAVNNASRHARAKHIWIRLQRNHGGIRLRIEDDGCGLPAGGSQPKGLGLKIMSYRASVIGARFSIAPRQGGGTRITCDWKPSESKEKAPSHEL